ncbi:deleted in azoospermia-like isoform X1 [Epinephelus fuscoguttatus]|uniref:RNA-binding protein n=1 Tax=Epinephelus coioides TaxID=94232 RepID=A0A5J6KSE1_EPICO|nr:deleted in azoospermia-like [Epinephelus lanceolatus]XP_049458239.1 deleted in azoospermia-like isoform X1 [Epinephelus fuscoguttatus]QEV86799.1 RNA-binding protein [Epinephelus coioides]
MDIHNPRSSNQTSPFQKLSNGYIPPRGKVVPNTLFVGWTNMTVDENDMREIFGRDGTVQEVKLITDRAGISKGYGFVRFNEDVDIQSILKQQIRFKGHNLRLGPAIMKERSSRAHVVVPDRRMSPTQYFCYTCCSPMGRGMAQPSPFISGGSHYSQPYFYSNFGGAMIPPMPMNHVQNAHAYQYPPPHWIADQWTQPIDQDCVDCGVQTMMNLM